MKNFTALLLCVIFLFISAKSFSNSDPYTIELERINMPGTPSIHSFAFAESNGKWIFIGGRTNGLHGFDTFAFPKQYSNQNIFVVDPGTAGTWSKNIFTDCSYTIADPLRSTNMEYFQDGNKLYIIGGYGYDSASNSLVTFPTLTVIDVAEIAQAVMTGSSITPYIRQITDARLQVCGGEMQKLGDYFYLVGGHKFTGYYSQFFNDQIYTNQIRKFKINDDGTNVTISNYSALTDTIEYHRRDMNVVPAVRPDGVTPYMILYGGVFKYNQDLPYLNPVYIDENGATVDYSFEQKMSQYTCSNLTAFNSNSGEFHTTFFGGTSLYYYNENTHMQVYDSLVPFIDDITTLTKNSTGVSEERISDVRMPALLGTNAKFILNESVPHFSNKVIKLNELPGRTFAGYIFGGIRSLYPNNSPSFPSDYILKVYITPKTLNVHHIEGSIPENFFLKQNYPNPFNPNTKIQFSIPSNSQAKLLVYDQLGREMSKLVDGRLDAGVYEVDFDGSLLSSGVYFYQLVTNNFTETKKMFLTK